MILNQRLDALLLEHGAAALLSALSAACEIQAARHELGGDWKQAHRWSALSRPLATLSEFPAHVDFRTLGPDAVPLVKVGVA